MPPLKAQCTGLHFACRAYSIFVFSVLGFVNQFHEPTTEALAAEHEGLQIFAPGPYRWIPHTGLYNLRRYLGFTFEFPKLQDVGNASKLRVLHNEGFNAALALETIRDLATDAGCLGNAGKHWLLEGIVVPWLQSSSTSLSNKGRSGSALPRIWRQVWTLSLDKG